MSPLNQSLQFAGNATSYVTIPYDVALNIGTADFTIQWYQYQTDNNSHPRVFQLGDYPSASLGLSIEGGTFYYWRAGFGPVGTGITNFKNVWVHFAISRVSGTTRIFMNGVKINQFSDSANIQPSTSLTIGNELSKTNASGFGGYIYGFDIEQGSGLYTSNFTVPYTFPSNGANTVVLLGGQNNYGTLGSTVVPSNVTNSNNIPVAPSTPCFLEGTKILCLNKSEQEEYIPIENIRKGVLVKTLKHGYLPVNMIGTTVIYNSESTIPQNKLYKCPKKNYPSLKDDLVITGYHSILEDNLTNQQYERTIEELGDFYVTEGKKRLMVYLDSRAEKYNKTGNFNIWHLALDNTSYYGNYGIYANGLLVESTSKRYLKELSGMKLM